MDQAARLDAKLVEGEERRETGERMVDDLLGEILAAVVEEGEGRHIQEVEEVVGGRVPVVEEVEGRQVPVVEKKDGRQVPVAVVEIDCTTPEVKVRGEDGGREESSSCSTEPAVEEMRRRSRRGEEGKKRSSVRRSRGKRTVKSGKDARARFKSSEDLIHRLYVCISGAADQLQTNFAGDFRSILKYVFLMNATQDEEEEDVVDEEEQSQESLSLSEGGEEEDEEEEGARRGPSPPGPTEPPRSPGYSLGEDALMSETEQSYLRAFPESGERVEGRRSREGREEGGLDPHLLSTSPPAGLAAMPVYASNLGNKKTLMQC